MSVAQLKGRDFLSFADLSLAEMQGLLQLATQMKAGTLHAQCRVGPQQRSPILGLLFSKASTRTRVSFSVAMYQLGGQVLDLNPTVTQVGRGEPIADTARVLDRYLDILAIRTYGQDELQTYADYAQIPVINALTDWEHPCQTLADLLTVQEAFGELAGLTLAYLGDGNNVAHSLLLGCALAGMHVRVATPPDYEPHPEIVAQAQQLAALRAGTGTPTEIVVTHDALAAVEGSQILYTDVWASMGQEGEADDRIPIFQPYQVNETLLAVADPEAIVLHCLPAHRGEEITEGVMEGQQSRIWDQAENRMHAQKALLACLLGFTLIP
ncbi:ornithine carbamoyltransferase [Trichothermofontia sichuanensis B231]|uniref:ornithine carbamoyltransferase n=1 Tax=Trichothermofontia sichuanensis TaxID=3045816 RepID=UPI0022471BF1|nr:ornithine carbamoyltransferase [Trichothermofontia sichuanensis]UZQ54737.1 ornithine carbamoyltransferase [Trichothermofontia sichuanensis B231]